MWVIYEFARLGAISVGMTTMRTWNGLGLILNSLEKVLAKDSLLGHMTIVIRKDAE